MNELELANRIREELILRENNIKEHEWIRMGLIDEASNIGVVKSDFLRKVGEIGYEVLDNQSRINSLKVLIKQFATKDNKNIKQDHLGQILAESERLKLSRTFVVDRLIPIILESIDIPIHEPKQKLNIIKAVSVVDLPLENAIDAGEIDEPKHIDGEKLQSSTIFRFFKDENYRITKYLLSIFTIIICFLVFNYKKDSKPIKNSKDVESLKIKQQEMNKLLLEGVKLVDEKGDHVEANIKFAQAFEYTSISEMNAELLKKHALIYSNKADALCEGVKTRNVTSLSNEFYKHAAILLGTKQETCK